MTRIQVLVDGSAYERTNHGRDLVRNAVNQSLETLGYVVKAQDIIAYFARYQTLIPFNLFYRLSDEWLQWLEPYQMKPKIHSCQKKRIHRRYVLFIDYCSVPSVPEQYLLYRWFVDSIIFSLQLSAFHTSHPVQLHIVASLESDVIMQQFVNGFPQVHANIERLELTPWTLDQATQLFYHVSHLTQQHARVQKRAYDVFRKQMSQFSPDQWQPELIAQQIGQSYSAITTTSQ